MVRTEVWACTGFTQDSGASYFSVFSLDGAMKGILRFVLGNWRCTCRPFSGGVLHLWNTGSTNRANIHSHRAAQV